jgi:phytoene synthase
MSTEETAEHVLARHGRSFHWAGRFMARDKLKRAAELYKLCRHIDDAVDEAATWEAAHEQLTRNMDKARAELRNLLARTPGTGIPDSLCYAALEELCRGVAGDIAQQNIADKDELLVYAYRVAGTVGILMCRILNVDDNRAVAYSVDLGIAMQCTNIARDIGEDWRAGHCYIPRDWRTADGAIKPEAIVRLLKLADKYYTSAEAGMAYLPAGARLAILCAARVYRRIGTKIARNPEAAQTRRIYVPAHEKALVTARAIGAFVARKKFHHTPPPHDDHLHNALAGLPGIADTVYSEQENSA